MSKIVYLPAKPGYGLIVRYRCAMDFLDEWDTEKGYNENTVWDWVQVPPLAGEGENTVTFTHGTPVWQTDGTETLRITSGMDVEDDLFSGEKIPMSEFSSHSLPDRFEFDYTREKVKGDPTTKETFLHLELIAVPHEEIKKMYPRMRGPGETSGEAATWIYPPVDGTKWKAAAEKAVAQYPKSAPKWENYGWSLFNLDRYSEAQAAFQKASELKPGDAWIMANLAVASYQAGDEKEALNFYSEAVKKNGNFGKWDDALKDISNWQPEAREALHALYKEWSAAQAGPPAPAPQPAKAP